MNKMFKNEVTGETREFEVADTRKRLILATNGSKWKVVPRPKPKSRSCRRDGIVSNLITICDELSSIKDELKSLESEEDLIEEIEQGQGREYPKDFNYGLDEGRKKQEELKLKLEEVKQQREAFIADAQCLVKKINIGEVEKLLDELQDWRDNMTGTSLESTQKYQILDECVVIFYEVINSLKSISNIYSEGDIERVMSVLREVINNLRSVEFPGMFYKGR